MGSLIEMMVPFKVKALCLPKEVRLATSPPYPNAEEHWKDEIMTRLNGKTWLVSAIRTNPDYTWKWGQKLPQEECFVVGIQEGEHITHYETLPCMLFLLVRDRENPIWWPDRYCEVVGG